VKTVHSHKRKVVSLTRDWVERLPIILLAYTTHETTGATPASMVFGRELRLLSDLLFGAPHGKEQSMTDYVVDIIDRLHDIHHYARQHLKVASDLMKAPYDPWPKLRVPGRRQSLAVPSDPEQRSHPSFSHPGKAHTR
jgi:hypothetical protein